MDGIEVKIVKEADIEQLVGLYKDAGWWHDSFGTAFISEIMKNSFCFAIAVKNGRIIGMGRALADSASDAYIQDVVVLHELRGQGIGKMIIRAIIDYLRSHDIDWIGLIGQPGTAHFYESLGFEVLKDHIPMKLNLDKSDKLK